MTEQVPSVGCVVHFVTTNGVHVPAVICGVFEAFDTVSLFIKDSTTDQAFFERGVAFEPSGLAVGSWHWPEYVPAKETSMEPPIDPPPDDGPGDMRPGETDV